MFQRLRVSFATAMMAITVVLHAAPPTLPDHMLTPGDVDPKLKTATLCSKKFSTDTVRSVSAAEKKEVFARYGIDPKSDRFEIDHLISLELGGKNSVENLWPQSYTTSPLNATIKDGLENRLHHLVCTQGHDKIPLDEAQTAIRGEWPKAYKKYLCDAGVKLTALQAKTCMALK